MSLWRRKQEQPALTPEEYLERFIAVLNRHGISVYILCESRPAQSSSYWAADLLFDDDRSYHFEFANAALSAWDETGEATALRTITKYREYCRQTKGTTEE